ncbi:hypothetical protein GCM10028818_24820 [Spirosoma horti]
METTMAEILELFIITYNRSTHLDSTLHQLVGCPFSGFSITIVDNCSTDNTYEIYLAYKEKFPRLNYIRNKVNIGADANVLRAAELSNNTYTWILCDDDEYDFADCDDILDVLEKEEVDAVMVGCPDVFGWPKKGLFDTPKNLIKKDFAYFGVPSFVPGSIFKTKLFQEQIRVSYTNIVNLFPAMTYYVKLYNEDRLVYVCKNKVVNAAAKAEYQYTYLRVMDAIINTFYLIDSPEVRQKSFDQTYPNLPYRRTVKHALMMQQKGSPMSKRTIFRYVSLVNWKRKIIFVLAYMVAPILNKSSFQNLYLKYIKKELVNPV